MTQSKFNYSTLSGDSHVGLSKDLKSRRPQVGPSSNVAIYLRNHCTEKVSLSIRLKNEASHSETENQPFKSFKKPSSASRVLTIITFTC